MCHGKIPQTACPQTLFIVLSHAGRSTKSRIHRRSLPEFPSIVVVLIVYKNYHPHSNGTITANQRCAMNPTIAPFWIMLAHPSDLGGYTSSAGKSLCQFLPHKRASTDSAHKRALKDAWDPQGWTCEQDCERWIRSHKEIILINTAQLPAW